MPFLRSILRLVVACTLFVSGASALAQPAASGTFPVDGRGLPTLAPMIARVAPAVVNISVTVRQAEDNPLARDPFFRRFFDLPEQRREDRQAAGSGVIVDAARGLVVTNHHVVDNAAEIVVVLTDRRQLRAKLIGSDPATDVALLSVPPERLTALRIADSDDLQVGDFVVALGNPFGIGQTVTSGIVSALGRSGLTAEAYEDFIQTDASINPGNSGGALVNLRGELVGINSAILAPSGGNVGIGFAIPTNMVRAVMDQLLKSGEVRRGRLGVSSTDVTPDFAREKKLPVTQGAVIVRIEPGSAAERAGLRPGDVVVAANGRPIRSSGDFRNRIGLTPAGEELDLQLLRENRPLNLRARVAEIAGAAAGDAIAQLPGLRVTGAGPERGPSEAVLVTSVERGSPAYGVGLRTGDVIVGVNRRRTRNPAELAEALRTNERPWRLTLLRGEARVQITIR
jgi:serine protease Do/serine protease DegQ